MNTEWDRRLREKLGNIALLLLQAKQGKEVQQLRGQLEEMQEQLGQAIASLDTANEVSQCDRQRNDNIREQLKYQLGQAQAELAESKQAEAKAKRFATQALASRDQAKMLGEEWKQQCMKVGADNLHLRDTLDWLRRGCPDSPVVAEDVAQCPKCGEEGPIPVGNGDEYQCLYCNETFLVDFEGYYPPDIFTAAD